MNMPFNVATANADIEAVSECEGLSRLCVIMCVIFF